jgi:hypothetical protein
MCQIDAFLVGHLHLPDFAGPVCGTKPSAGEVADWVSDWVSDWYQIGIRLVADERVAGQPLWVGWVVSVGQWGLLMRDGAGASRCDFFWGKCWFWLNPVAGSTAFLFPFVLLLCVVVCFALFVPATKAVGVCVCVCVREGGGCASELGTSPIHIPIISQSISQLYPNPYPNYIPIAVPLVKRASASYIIKSILFLIIDRRKSSPLI